MLSNKRKSSLKLALKLITIASRLSLRFLYSSTQDTRIKSRYTLTQSRLVRFLQLTFSSPLFKRVNYDVADKVSNDELTDLRPPWKNSFDVIEECKTSMSLLSPRVIGARTRGAP